MTENLEFVLVEVADTASKLYDSLEDGIQLNDAFVILSEASDIEAIVERFPAALAERVNITPENSVRLNQLFIDRFDIRNDTVEKDIEAIFMLAQKIYVAVTVGINVVKDAQLVIANFGKAPLTV